jgi:hypothetical protein
MLPQLHDPIDRKRSFLEITIRDPIVRLFPCDLSWTTRHWYMRAIYTPRIPAIIILLGLSLLPSSPSWLASHRRYDECLRTLSTLRQLPIDDESVRQEWIDIRVEAEFQRELHLTRFGELPEQAWSQLKIEFRKWGDTFSKGCRRRTLVGVGVRLLLPLCSHLFYILKVLLIYLCVCQLSFFQQFVRARFTPTNLTI